MAGASIEALSKEALDALKKATAKTKNDLSKRLAGDAVSKLQRAAEHRTLSQHAEIEHLRTQVSTLRAQNTLLHDQKETLINALRSEHDHFAGDSLFHSLSDCLKQLQKVLPTLQPKEAKPAPPPTTAKALPRRSPRRRTRASYRQQSSAVLDGSDEALPSDVSAIIAESHTSPVLDSPQWDTNHVGALFNTLRKAESTLATIAQLQGISAEAQVGDGGVPRRLKPPPLPLPSSMGGVPNSGVPGRGLRILTMDGGGVRGVVMVEALRKLEYETGRQVHELFDLIVGTSSGGFLAALVGIKRASLAEAAEVYNHIRLALCQISPMWQNVKRLATGASHSADVARAYLLTVFGDGLLRDAPASPKVAMLGTSIDTDPAQPFLFRSYALSDSAAARTLLQGSCDMPVYQAARATSSAPTYYEPELINGHRYVDGGISANNPVLVALAEAAVLWPSRPVECVVSLGTGVPTLRPGNVVALTDWLGVVFGLSMSSHTTHYIAHALLPPNVYFRLDAPGVGDFNLTEGDAAVTCDMIRAGQSYVRENHALFSAVADALAPERPRKGAAAPLQWPPKGAFMQPVIEQEAAAAAAAAAALAPQHAATPASSPSGSPSAAATHAAAPPASPSGGLAGHLTLRCGSRGKRRRSGGGGDATSCTKVARQGGELGPEEGGIISWLSGVPVIGELVTPAASPQAGDRQGGE